MNSNIAWTPELDEAFWSSLKVAEGRGSLEMVVDIVSDEPKQKMLVNLIDALHKMNAVYGQGDCWWRSEGKVSVNLLEYEKVTDSYLHCYIHQSEVTVDSTQHLVKFNFIPFDMKIDGYLISDDGSFRVRHFKCTSEYTPINSGALRGMGQWVTRFDEVVDNG
ncbi:hypothetical protein GR11A_00062 [Vibrio phage vB_VcorM_GR11A]|nr:hypothetical protein GR11A_00062 [Vibrio phage vB_VcorM_GR11A]